MEEEKPEEEIEETDKDKWAIERKTANQANKKMADRFHDYKINLTLYCVPDKALELRTVICMETREALVSVDADKFHVAIALDQLLIIRALGLIRELLLIFESADSAICSDSYLSLFLYFCLLIFDLDYYSLH